MKYIIHYEAIGTHRTFSWNGKSENLGNKIIELLQVFEKKYSRFDPNSFVGQLNLNRFVQTDDEMLIDMIGYGKKAQILTNGLFSLFVGTHLENLGYNPDYDFTVTGQYTDITASEVIISNGLIRLSGIGNIDLGGLGKGYVIDVIKRFFIDSGIESFVINGGGDIYQQDDEMYRGPITLQDPSNPHKYIGTLSTTKGGYASSGRNFRTRGKDLHHLIDATSGLPVKTEILGVFTYHPTSALYADLASTILFISPLDLIEHYANKLEVEYFIVFSDYSSVRSPKYPLILE